MKKKWIVGILTAVCAVVGAMGLSACNYLDYWQYPTEEMLYFQRIEGKDEYRVVSIGTYQGSALVIPQTYKDLPVTEVGASAFKDMSNITSVTIPNTVVKISDAAFEGCINLTSVTLSSQLATIGNYAFRNCEGLTQLIFPETLDFIGYWAFNGCAALETVYYKGTTEDWQSVGVALYNDELTAAARYDYSAQEPYCTPESEHWHYVDGAMVLWSTVRHDWGEITVVQPTCEAEGCDLQICSLCEKEKRMNPTKKLEHDWEVTTVAPTCDLQGYDSRECKDCDAKDKVNYVPNIGHDWGEKTTVAPTCVDEGYDQRVCGVCDGVEKTNFVNANGHGDMLNGNCNVCGTQLSTEGVEYQLSNDGTYAIVKAYTGSATSVRIADTYQGAAITTIAASAFANCSILQLVEIPASVTTIDTKAFFGCSALNTIIVAEGNTAFSSVGGHLYTADRKTLVQYALGSAATSFTAPASVTAIGAYAFAGNTALKNVRLLNGVEHIGERAFENCTALTSVTLSDTITVIGNSAFAKCAALTEINMPAALTEISGWAFSDCTALTSIVFQDNVKKIGEYAFFNCTSLTNVTLSSTLETIASNAFAWCFVLREIIIPASVTSVGANAFTKCVALTIKCVVAEQPATWSEDWNSNNCPVTWGYAVQA